MAKILKPQIERRLEKVRPGTEARIEAAKDICRFLKTGTERERFYDACVHLLKDLESQRILLYLPFEILEDAPEHFRDVFTDAWYNLLDTKDVRENFHLGDCFEADARPQALERVVKCAHLTPWLIKYGYLGAEDIEDILDDNSHDQVLLQSFKDTWGYIEKNEILSSSSLSSLMVWTDPLPERKKPEPLFITEARKKWLAEASEPVSLLTPNANLEGPFFENLSVVKPELEKIAASLRPHDIVVVGGSVLKGYSVSYSDLDVSDLGRFEQLNGFQPGDPDAAHIYLDKTWIGGSAVEDDLEAIVDSIENHYIGLPCSDDRQRTINRLEGDLIQYRLLHKGFARFTGKNYNRPAIPNEMDEDCAFYDDDFRKIATMIYAKYVWLAKK